MREKNVHMSSVCVGIRGPVYGVYEIRGCLEDHGKSGGNGERIEKLNKTKK